MTGWFGESWGAPVCEPEDHVPTPVGKSCLACLEMIKAGDQGVTMPLIIAEGRVLPCAYHLDCYLRKILPHGRDCPRCRGKQLDEHAQFCEYRQSGGNCNCVALEDL